MIPQIDNNLLYNLPNDTELPSKTYKINNNSTQTFIDLGEPSEIEQSNLIQISNLAYPKIDITVKGNNYQETRNGYNLFNPDKALSIATKTQGDATVTKNTDGSFTITGSGQLSSAFGGDYVDYTHEETLKLIKLGLLKCDFGAVTRPNCFVEFFKKVDGKSTRLFVLENNTSSTVSKEITEEILNSEELFMRLSFYGGNGLDIIPGTIKPMLYQDGDGTFEQFGKSPSPEYPSKIETVGSDGNIELNVVNKNIMPIKIGQYWEYTQNGIQNKGRNEGVVLTEFKVPKGQTIKINVIFKTLPTTDTSFIGYIDNVNTKELHFEQFSLHLTVNKLYTKTYIPTKDETISYRMCGNTNSDIFEFQIWAEINEVTNYEKHQSYNEIIPIQKEMLDGDYISDKEYHTWGKYVCTGNENWILNGKAFYIDTITDYAIINNIPICNYFPGVPNVTGSQSGEFDKACVAFINTLEYKRFYICYPEITTVNDLKAFLQEKHNSGNPVTIYYKLANILELPLTEEQQKIVNTIKNLSINFMPINIFSIDTLTPILNVKYYTSSNVNVDTIESDRIIGFVDGIDAMKQAIYHILNTERYAYLIYDDNYGVELEQYIGKDLDYIEATIEQTLREALTHDLRIQEVSVTSINQISNDIVHINMVVTTIFGNIEMEVNINV